MAASSDLATAIRHRVRSRVREACIHGSIVPDRYEAAVVETIRADGASSLMVERSGMVDWVTRLMGREPTAYERGLIAGLALAIATEIP